MAAGSDFLLSRRSVVAGLAAATAAPVAVCHAADEPVSPVARGMLADNALAKAFQPIPGNHDIGDVELDGPDGTRSFADFRGKTLIVPLWAEWCGPCLSELPDFARLERMYGSASFAIVPVLTGTRKAFKPPLLASVFAKMGTSVFEPLIEHRYGSRLLKMLAMQSNHEIAIPCNVLVSPTGAVVAREIGKLTADTAPDANAALRSATTAQTLWSTPVADEFVGALATGFLTRL